MSYKDNAWIGRPKVGVQAVPAGGPKIRLFCFPPGPPQPATLSTRRLFCFPPGPPQPATLSAALLACRSAWPEPPQPTAAEPRSSLSTGSRAEIGTQQCLPAVSERSFSSSLFLLSLSRLPSPPSLSPCARLARCRNQPLGLLPHCTPRCAKRFLLPRSFLLLLTRAAVRRLSQPGAGRPPSSPTAGWTGCDAFACGAAVWRERTAAILPKTDPGAVPWAAAPSMLRHTPNPNSRCLPSKNTEQLHVCNTRALPAATPAPARRAHRWNS